MLPAADESAPKHDPYAALRSPGFLLYLIGWVAAILGAQMGSVALQYDIYQRTHNPLSLGWVGLVQAIPVIALALPAGHVADRFDRRRVLIFTQVLASLCGIALAIVSHASGSIGWMYALICLAATAAALGGPSRSALVPQIVPTHLVSNAITWSSSAFQTASVVGPALGGLLLLHSVPAAYIADAALGATFAVAMLFLSIAPPVRSKEPANLRTLTEGIRFIFRNEIILATISLDLFAVLLGGAVYLLPAFQKDILRCGSVGFGFLRAAPAMGAVTMGLLIAHLPPMKHAGRSMLWAVAGFGAATIVFGLSRSFTLSFIMLFLTGAFDNISVVVRHTLVQVLAPDAMRGRISAVNNVFIGASNELGGFESGLTGRLLGPVASVVYGGIGTLCVVMGAAILWPKLRQFGSLADAKPIEEETALAAEPIVNTDAAMP